MHPDCAHWAIFDTPLSPFDCLIVASPETLLFLIYPFGPEGTITHTLTFRELNQVEKRHTFIILLHILNLRKEYVVLSCNVFSYMHLRCALPVALQVHLNLVRTL